MVSSSDSSSAARVAAGSCAPDGIPLSLVAVGRRRVVIAVDGPGRAELEREGVMPGTRVLVAARTPLGGPVIVEARGARLAISADVAARILTRGLEPGPGAT